MKIKQNFNILVVLLIVCSLFGYGCGEWTDPEAEQYAGTIVDSEFDDPSQSGGEDDPDEPTSGLPEKDDQFYADLRAYRQTPHKKIGGWFGGWSGYGGKRLSSGALSGLPYAVDYACLWLFTTGNGLSIENLHRDAEEFHRRGGVTLMCWSAREIGDGMTPPGQSASALFGTGDAGIAKYAQAIVDTCVKYHIDGFENDLESGGSLSSSRRTMNLFLRELIDRFKIAHQQNPETCAGIVSVDIPRAWWTYWTPLEADVVKDLYMIQWQDYDQCDSQSALNSFVAGMISNNNSAYEQAREKTISTATFERGEGDKSRLLKAINLNYQYSDGFEFAGYGAYHIEYDFPNNSYEYLRECIKAANPTIRDDFNVGF